MARVGVFPPVVLEHQPEARHMRSNVEHLPGCSNTMPPPSRIPGQLVGM